jgi:ABC-type transporter Mla maintaining outer membrane lipid asymmetry permease subunit MlaE
MLLKGIVVGSVIGLVSIALFWRALSGTFAHDGRPYVVDLRPLAASFFGGVVIGVAVVFALVYYGLDVRRNPTLTRLWLFFDIRFRTS